MRRLLICCLLLALCQGGFAQKWEYDFIVPDDGGFMEAVHAANARLDKDKRFRIFIRAGHYFVKGEGDTLSTTELGQEVRFPSPITTLTASNTSIVGEDWTTTQVENRPVHEGISITSTLFVKGADHTYLQDFELWCNLRDNVNPLAGRAVSLHERNCSRNILVNMSLNSTQDTYWTNEGGTTYLDGCHVAGTVDFICGGGTVFFYQCDIELIKRSNYEKRDIIVAPATAEHLDYGFVFDRCRVYSADSVRFHLGRPWRYYPRCAFVNCRFETLPDPVGWTNMSGNRPKLLTEYGSVDKAGRMIDLSQRRRVFEDRQKRQYEVDYSPVLTDEEVKAYTLDKVFPDWNPREGARQVTPPLVTLRGRTVRWEDIPEAGCYAVYLDDTLHTFVTEPEYVVPLTYSTGTRVAIRCANQMGGLGKMSNTVVI